MQDFRARSVLATCVVVSLTALTALTGRVPAAAAADPTPVTTYAALQSALSAGDASIALGADIDGTGAGGLTVPANATLDLAGHDLTVVGAFDATTSIGQPGVALAGGVTLTVTDTTAAPGTLSATGATLSSAPQSDDGTAGAGIRTTGAALVVEGTARLQSFGGGVATGAGADGYSGQPAAAGIGADGVNYSTAGPLTVLDSAEVTAVGGSVSCATKVSEGGGGAGVGGAGGASSYQGGDGGSVSIAGSATLVATGGSATCSYAGGGAGIGGGGAGAGYDGNLFGGAGGSFTVADDLVTISATAGGSTYGGAGIGGGGGYNRQGTPATVSLPPLAITSVTSAGAAASGPITGGTPLTIGGTGFVTGLVTGVSVGGRPLAGLTVTGGRITGTVAAGTAVGPADVVVDRAYSTPASATATDGFDYAPVAEVGTGADLRNWVATPPAVEGVTTVRLSADIALTGDLTVPAGTTVQVPSGVTLTNGATVTGPGTLSGAGTLANDGAIAAGVVDVAGGLQLTGHAYPVALDPGAGQVSPASLLVYASTIDAALGYALPTATRLDHTFAGWQHDGATFDPATVLTGPLTLQAEWTADAPHLTSLSPADLPTTGGSLTITGTDLAQVSTVWLGTAVVTGDDVEHGGADDDTTLTVPVPSVSVTGAVDVAAGGGAGGTSNTLAFTYTLAPLATPPAVTVAGTGTLPGYAPASLTSPATSPVAPGAITPARVSLKGKAKVGKLLTAVVGGWAPAEVTVSYQWYAGNKALKGATSAALKLTKKLHGKKITVVVTAALAGYADATVTSKPTRKVASR